MKLHPPSSFAKKLTPRRSISWSVVHPELISARPDPYSLSFSSTSSAGDLYRCAHAVWVLAVHSWGMRNMAAA